MARYSAALVLYDVKKISLSSSASRASQVPYERWSSVQRAQICARLEKLKVLGELSRAPSGGKGTRLAAMLPDMSHSRVSAGETIYSEGDACDNFYIIVYGGVQLSRASKHGSTGGRAGPILLSEANAGDSFGDLAALSAGRVQPRRPRE